MSHEVLVVDDAPHIRRMIEYVLESIGCHVTLAEDGREAWQLLQSNMPDLLISDVMMPRMNGIELVTQIRCDERLSRLPVMLLTAKGGEMPADYAARHRLEAILSKPFSPSALQERVTGLLGIETEALAAAT